MAGKIRKKFIQKDYIRNFTFPIIEGEPGFGKLTKDEAGCLEDDLHQA